MFIRLLLVCFSFLGTHCLFVDSAFSFLQKNQKNSVSSNNSFILRAKGFRIDELYQRQDVGSKRVFYRKDDRLYWFLQSKEIQIKLELNKSQLASIKRLSEGVGEKMMSKVNREYFGGRKGQPETLNDVRDVVESYDRDIKGILSNSQIKRLDLIRQQEQFLNSNDFEALLAIKYFSGDRSKLNASLAKMAPAIRKVQLEGNQLVLNCIEDLFPGYVETESADSFPALPINLFLCGLRNRGIMMEFSENNIKSDVEKFQSNFWVVSGPVFLTSPTGGLEIYKKKHSVGKFEVPLNLLIRNRKLELSIDQRRYFLNMLDGKVPTLSPEDRKEYEGIKKILKEQYLDREEKMEVIKRRREIRELVVSGSIVKIQKKLSAKQNSWLKDQIKIINLFMVGPDCVFENGDVEKIANSNLESKISKHIEILQKFVVESEELLGKKFRQLMCKDIQNQIDPKVFSADGKFYEKFLNFSVKR